jgi:IS5 family transposase
MYGSEGRVRWQHHILKAHIGVDANSGLVHTVIVTAANVNDVTQGHGLLHRQESVVFADAGYHGAAKRAEATGMDWHLAMRPGKRRVLDKNSPGANCSIRQNNSRTVSEPRWIISLGF